MIDQKKNDARDAEEAGDQAVEQVRLQIYAERAAEGVDEDQQNEAESGVQQKFEDLFDRLEKNADQQNDADHGGGGQQAAV